MRHYKRGLKIMDLTAFYQCKENNLPVIVFDMNKTGNLLQVDKGEKVGTLVKRGGRKVTNDKEGTRTRK